MDTVKVMFPVIVMLVLGYICKRTAFISEKGMNDIKKYITLIALPVTVFHSVGTASLNKDTIIIIISMFTFLCLALGIGFLCRPLIPEPYKNYVPFLLTAYEGGMFGYPLYQNLFGADKLANIVIVDIAGCIWGFSIYYGMLALVDQKTKFSMKAIGKTAIHSPTFLGVMLGLLLNLTGIMKLLVESPIGSTYLATKDIIVAPLTAMILLCVGYSVEIDKTLFNVSLKTMVLRMIIFAVLGFALIKLLPGIMADRYILAAFLMLFICTPAFSLPGFVKNKDAAGYFSMTTSLCLVITIIGYAVIATVFR